MKFQKVRAEREKALNDALKLIEKDFGKGSIMRLGDVQSKRFK